MRFIIPELLSMECIEARERLRVRRVRRRTAEEGLNALLPSMLLSHRDPCLTSVYKEKDLLESSL